jgi:hypothetical protein
MSYSAEALVQYRLKRAFETLDDARSLAEQNRWNSAANRLYYAAYYAVLALFVGINVKPSTHTGVRQLFNQHFIKTGRLEPRFGQTFSYLFNVRQEGDYVDFQMFTEEEIKPLLGRAEELLVAVKQLLT